MFQPCFIPFDDASIGHLIPAELNDPFAANSSAIGRLAAQKFQDYIEAQQHNWEHDFGFTAGTDESIRGKMFGVLVVENSAGKLGFLGTSSGTVAPEDRSGKLVPSQIDLRQKDHFITVGMQELTEIGQQIKQLESKPSAHNEHAILELKNKRSAHSLALQTRLFDAYQFLNQTGERKSLRSIFEDHADHKPPAGAGECAAPKLLQYAFSHQLKPLAIAEFWWGKSNKSNTRQHREFYPACEEKCRPILTYMLSR